jgi:hypothetical protein
LGLIGVADLTVVAALRRVAVGDISKSVRAFALASLGEISDVESVEMLARAADGLDVTLRRAAIYGLLVSTSEQAQAAASRALDSEGFLTRRRLRREARHFVHRHRPRRRSDAQHDPT